MEQLTILTDHAAIKQWARDNRAKPAVVADEADVLLNGTIRFDFPGTDDQTDLAGIADIDWHNFFAIFEDRKLALAVTGSKYEFVDREIAEHKNNEDSSSEDFAYTTKI